MLINFGYTVFWWDDVVETVTQATTAQAHAAFINNFSLFAEQELRGYAIVDTGATRSMSGINLLLHVQEELLDSTGADQVVVDPNQRTRFTYANGESGASFGRVGIPHRLALPQEGECIWFTAVGTPSPMLLGLDWLDQAYANVDAHTGVMTFADGTPPEQLVSLSTGHWALPLFDEEDTVPSTQ